VCLNHDILTKALVPADKLITPLCLFMSLDVIYCVKLIIHCPVISECVTKVTFGKMHMIMEVIVLVIC
jgi:hypothetical protein